MTERQFYDRLKTETIYMYDDQEETYIKSVPGGECFAKLKGGNEFKIKSDNDIVIRAIYSDKEVTKKEYDQA